MFDMEIDWSKRLYFDYGKILGHDGGFGDVSEELPQLEETFVNTSKLW
jgi:hypothetical protein